MKDITMKTVNLYVLLFVSLHSCFFGHALYYDKEDTPVLRLYNKTDGTYKVLPVNPDSIGLQIDLKKPLLIYTFSVNSDPKSVEVSTIIPALMTHSNAQIVLYDWSKKNDLDPLSLLKTKQVSEFLKVLQPLGCELGQALAKMAESGLDPKNITLIGHGLGANLMAYAGKCFEKIFGDKLKLIWALDPAGSLYAKYFEVAPQLDKTSADHVYVLHTDLDGYGSRVSMGTVDIFAGYSDDYVMQPGCFHKASERSWNSKYSCNHDHAWKMFIAGVRLPKLLPAVHAPNGYTWLNGEGDPKNMIYVTLEINPRANGNYFLRLAPNFPYSLHAKGIYPPVRKYL